MLLIIVVAGVGVVAVEKSAAPRSPEESAHGGGERGTPGRASSSSTSATPLGSGRAPAGQRGARHVPGRRRLAAATHKRQEPEVDSISAAGFEIH